ncbi:Inner membrane protein YebE|nr:Inner membrane protein YebE [Candidatus Pantoea persica]
MDVDHFMKRSYLNALKIPQDVRDGIDGDLRAQKAQLPAD